jgi:hypothetical protein
MTIAKLKASGRFGRLMVEAEGMKRTRPQLYGQCSEASSVETNT